MFIVGELINASRKAVGAAIERQDAEWIAKLAADQFENGAGYIDVNAGVFVDREPAYLKWLVRTVQDKTGAPCCIDSPDPKAIEAALTVHQGLAMINSISLEKERYDALVPMIKGTDLKIIALCMSDAGMPVAAEERMAVADRLINGLVQSNVPIHNIYVDPLVQPVATNTGYGAAFLKAIEGIMSAFPGIHTICGLSNVSYGLPNRRFLNQAFMTMAIAKGLDSAIVNPLDKPMMLGIIAAEMLAGRDDFCMNYLKAYRAGKFDLQALIDHSS